jgi:hypothetical protein
MSRLTSSRNRTIILEIATPFMLLACLKSINSSLTTAKRLTAFTDELSENQNVKDQLERRTKLRTLCETRWSSRADSLYTFRTAFAVVSALETLKADHDDKAAECMNAILRFPLPSGREIQSTTKFSNRLTDLPIG